MRTTLRCGILAVGVGLFGCNAGAQEPQQLLRDYLDAYMRGDEAAVVQRLAPDVTMYGSDSAEVVHGVEGVRKLMEQDQKLWHGAARLGPVERLTTSASRDLVVMFFDSTFEMGTMPAMPLRFAMAWRKEHGRWLLVQSSNVAPTVHQSASELLTGADAR